MSTRLSPYTVSNMRRHGFLTALLSAKVRDPEPRRAEEVTAYRCPDCGDLHEDEDDALQCCEPAGHDQDAEIACPVCTVKHIDHREAADCCLWRDLDAPTRWRVADAVEAGATWAEALSAQGVQQ